VVCVEVDDENFFDAVVVDGVLGGDGDVVAEAEAVKLGSHRVVARRANERNAVGQVTWEPKVSLKCKVFYINDVVKIYLGSFQMFNFKATSLKRPPERNTAHLGHSQVTKKKVL